MSVSVNQYIEEKRNELGMELNDLRVLISSILDVDMKDLINYELDDNQINELDKKLLKITEGYPEQYAYGYQWFLNSKIIVNKNVLIPRNETEQFTEEVINVINSYFPKDKKLTLIEVGTGSGAIAISLSKYIKNDCDILATDISSKALAVAKKNIEEHKCRNIILHKANVLKRMPKEIDVIISNPPYIGKADRHVAEAVRKHEPKVALYAKENGLDIIQKLVKQSKKILSDKWIVALEFGWKQKEEIKEIIDKNYTNISYNFYKDYSGNWRFIIIKGKGENNEDIKNKN